MHQNCTKGRLGLFCGRVSVWCSSYITWRVSTDRSIRLQQLRDQVRSLVPVPTTPVHVSVPRNLQWAKFVFIHRDSHRTPLQRPYEGPFRVIQPGPKTFQVDIGGRNETVSVDRLKPANVDMEQPPQVAKPSRRGRPKNPVASRRVKTRNKDTSPEQPQYTRSGRRVKPPQ